MPDAHPAARPTRRTAGLGRALRAGVWEIAIFGSATETFAQRNLGRGIEESIAMFTPVVSRACGGRAGPGVPVDVLRRPAGR